MSETAAGKYLTRLALVEFAQNEIGVPLSLSTVNKDVHFGRGPEPAGRYGNKDIYTIEEARRYVLSRISKRATEGAAA